MLKPHQSMSTEWSQHEIKKSNLKKYILLTFILAICNYMILVFNNKSMMLYNNLRSKLLKHEPKIGLFTVNSGDLIVFPAKHFSVFEHKFYISISSNWSDDCKKYPGIFFSIIFFLHSEKGISTSVMKILNNNR